MLPLTKPARGRAVNSQLDLVAIVELNVIPPGFPTPLTPALLDISQPLKSVSKPSTKWPICQSYPSSAPPMTPLGAVELVPTAAIFEITFGPAAMKAPVGVSVYFELPNAPPTVPPT